MTPVIGVLLRHGETRDNVAWKTQDDFDPLTKRGRLQAALVGERLRQDQQAGYVQPITQILTSDLLRATQTAEIVQEFLEVPIRPSGLLRERRNPMWLEGFSIDDPTVLAYKQAMDEAALDETWEARHFGAENLWSVKQRVQKFLSQLSEEFRGQRVLIVTHGTPWKLVMAELLLGQLWTLQHWQQLNSALRTDNAGLTTFQGKEIWQVNDTRHLLG